MSKLSKADAAEKKALNDAADELSAAGDVRGAENLRCIADTIRPPKTGDWRR